MTSSSNSTGQSDEPSIGRSLAPHNIWEVDAKERFTLEDGSPACYLTITDEKTGAWGYWEIYHDYKCIKRVSATDRLSEERLKNLSVYQ